MRKQTLLLIVLCILFTFQGIRFLTANTNFQNEVNLSLSFDFDNTNPVDTTPSTESCGFIKAAGHYADTPFDNARFDTARETGDGYTISSTTMRGNDTQIFSVNIDKNGELVDLNAMSSTSIGSIPNLLNTRVEAPNLIVEKQATDGTIAWTSNLSFEGFDIPNYLFHKAYLTDDGVFVLGSFVTPKGDHLFHSFVAKLTLEGTLSSKTVDGPLPKEMYITGATLHKVTDAYVFDISANVNQNQLAFIGVSADGKTVWHQEHASDLPSNTHIEVKVSPDGNFIYAANVNNGSAYLEKVNAQTGAEVYVKNLDAALNEALDLENHFRSSFNWDNFLLLNDGGVVLGYDVFYITSGYVDAFVFTKLDAAGNIVWANSLEGERTLNPLLATSDGGYLFASNSASSSTFSTMKITAEGQITPTCGGFNHPTHESIPLACDLFYTFKNGKLTITGEGLHSKHVIFRVFDPNWHKLFDCVDKCDHPIVLEGLTKEGTYHVSFNTYIDHWVEICDGIVDIKPN